VLGIGLLEFATITGDRAKSAWRLLVAGGAVYWGALFGGDGVAHASLLIAALFLIVSGVMRKDDVVTSFKFLALQLLGLVWVVGLGLHLVLVRRLESGLEWFAILMIIVIAADSGAYFAGRAFGKHKLYEKVSPKKTWEGVFGGMAAAVAALYVVRGTFFTELSAVDCVVLGIFVSMTSVIGDLAESLLKRAVDVKDSGAIMPGHGGVLDRTDSILFGAPVIYLYVTHCLGVLA
jgi:phosphatidate cytidylyltransferase